MATVMKKKLIFFLQIPWSWIKQRPQFLAEGLSNNYSVTVVNIEVLGKKKEIPNNNIKFWTIYRLPFERFFIIRKLSHLLIRIQLFLKCERFDFVWLTSPLQYNYSKYFTKNSVIIYDCMDDHLSFSNNPSINEKKFVYEKKVYQEASIVLCSSSFLKGKLIERYGYRDVEVVNNAVADYVLSDYFGGCVKKSSTCLNGDFNISYFGTISEWFDFSLLEFVLNNVPSVTFHLFGPSVVAIPYHSRLIYHGILKHEDVFPAMLASDALIMPFEITELIKSVNPVKLYEYIASGKPCLAPEYGESLPFSAFVHLYKSPIDCVDIINTISHEAIEKDEEDRKQFIQTNTWSCRVNQIINLIQEL